MLIGDPIGDVLGELKGEFLGDGAGDVLGETRGELKGDRRLGGGNLKVARLRSGSGGGSSLPSAKGVLGGEVGESRLGFCE